MRELFLHVHPNKTGGTSIRRTLGITHQPEHLRAVHLRKLYAGSWRDAFKFSIIRNPYDRVVSMYEYRKRIDHRGLGSSGTSFEDWVRQVFFHRSGIYFNKPKFFQPCLYWIIDDSTGEIIVDKVYRFENFPEIWDDLIPRAAAAGIAIDRESVLHEKQNPGRVPFQEYYSDNTTRRIVRRFFAKDLVEFGYSFTTNPLQL